MQQTQETWVQSLGREDRLEKEMATHCSILAWEIPRTEKPGGLQFVGLYDSCYLLPNRKVVSLHTFELGFEG